MSDENKNCCSTETGEPTATRSAAPMWIIVVTLALICFGGLYLDSHGGWFDKNVYAPYGSREQLDSFQPKSGAAAAMARGKTVYEGVCGICHGSDGAGKPGQFPALAGSEWVTAKGCNRLVHIPLAGVAGAIKVQGKDWNLNMAAMGAALPDEDVAAVLTYIRSSWGNKAEAVTADDVKKVRAEIGKSPQPYSGAQLDAMPE
jgi:mono/diheme cytochrome c family protein